MPSEAGEPIDGPPIQARPVRGAALPRALRAQSSCIPRALAGAQALQGAVSRRRAWRPLASRLDDDLRLIIALRAAIWRLLPRAALQSPSTRPRAWAGNLISAIEDGGLRAASDVYKRRRDGRPGVELRPEFSNIAIFNPDWKRTSTTDHHRLTERQLLVLITTYPRISRHPQPY